MQKDYKILFISEAQLGDLLLLTPALRALKEARPYAKITVLIMHRRIYSGNDLCDAGIQVSKFEGTSQALMNNTDVDAVLELDRRFIRRLTGLKRIKAELHCISFLKKKKFDAIVCAFPQSRFVIWAFLTGVKIRVGQKKQSLSWLLTHKPNIKAKENGVLKYYCDLASQLGAKAKNYNTVYNVSEEEKKHAQNYLVRNGVDVSKKIVCIHPGASEPHKIWSPQFFAQVADYIISSNIAQVIICSSPYDKAAVEEICRYSKNKLKVFELTSIRELGAVISLCGLCMVNNSGPRHLSAAIGIKNISIFQKYDDGEWRIYDDVNNPVIEYENRCSVCFNNKCESKIKEGEQFGSECMWEVTPEKVISKINEIL